MKIEVSDEQVYVIVEALDLFSRVLIGQVEEVGGVMSKYNVNMLDSEVVGSVGNQYTQHKPDKKAYDAHHDFTDAIRSLKHNLLGIHANGSYGIHSDAVHDNSRVAYDIQQVLRNHLAWKNHKGDSVAGTMGVSFDKPYQTSKLELPKIVEEL